jgi:hypothetical protein
MPFWHDALDTAKEKYNVANISDPHGTPTGNTAISYTNQVCLSFC